jgi:hypothetical protein
MATVSTAGAVAADLSQTHVAAYSVAQRARRHTDPVTAGLSIGAAGEIKACAIYRCFETAALAEGTAGAAAAELT